MEKLDFHTSFEHLVGNEYPKMIQILELTEYVRYSILLVLEYLTDILLVFKIKTFSLLLLKICIYLNLTKQFVVY